MQCERGFLYLELQRDHGARDSVLSRSNRDLQLRNRCGADRIYAYDVQHLTEGISLAGVFESGLPSTASRVFSSSDLDFTGASFGSSASIFQSTGGSSVGSLGGTRFTITTFFSP